MKIRTWLVNFTLWERRHGCIGYSAGLRQWWVVCSRSPPARSDIDGIVDSSSFRLHFGEVLKGQRLRISLSPLRD